MTLVAVGVRDAFDEAVRAQSAEVVGHLSAGDVLGRACRAGARGGVRRSRLVNPWGSSRKTQQGREQGVDAGVGRSAVPAMRVPVSVVTGSVSSARACGAVGSGSWLSRWTSSRRRLAVKPICRRAGRLVSRLPMPKSQVSLIVVSVRSARPCLWYCLILACL